MSILIRNSKEEEKRRNSQIGTITKRGENTYFFVTYAAGIESIVKL